MQSPLALIVDGVAAAEDVTVADGALSFIISTSLDGTACLWQSDSVLVGIFGQPQRWILGDIRTYSVLQKGRKMVKTALKRMLKDASEPVFTDGCRIPSLRSDAINSTGTREETSQSFAHSSSLTITLFHPQKNVFRTHPSS